MMRVAMVIVAGLWCAAWASAADTPAPAPARAPATQPAGDVAPLPLKLPMPQIEGTPKNLPAGLRLEPDWQKKPKRPPFMAPAGTTNMALKKPVTSSEPMPLGADLTAMTDGDKEAGDGHFARLGFGTQWVQVDLGEPVSIAAIVFWHRHEIVVFFRDVIVQVADDADFLTNVRTLFNNDDDNSSGLGIGKDYEYQDTYEGKLVEGRQEKARYVRIYGRGSTNEDDSTCFTEIEVWGKPAK